MKTAVIVDCVRTPIGRAHPERGFFRDVRGDDLGVACVEALVRRTGIDPHQIEDVILGNTQQTLEHGMNAARTIALMAGLSMETGGTTVNRLCGSSLQALHQAAHAIAAGAEDVHVVGGLEHMHHVPMDHGFDVNPKLFRVTSRAALHMGATAEFLAQTQSISRADQDAFALRSHQLASRAHDAGEFQPELVPIFGRDEQGNRILVQRDQCVRGDTSLEALAALATYAFEHPGDPFPRVVASGPVFEAELTFETRDEKTGAPTGFARRTAVYDPGGAKAEKVDKLGEGHHHAGTPASTRGRAR